MINLIDISYAITILMLVVLGLAIVFGMLRVINMAHGEKIMLGAYSVYITESLALSRTYTFILGVILAVVSTSLVGSLMYMLIVKRIKERLLDSILATWGVAIVIKQLVIIGFGAQGQHVNAPVESTVIIFGHQYPVYRLIVIATSIIVILLIYLLFFKTKFGIQSRAVMSNPTLASCIGINREKMNVYSFTIGSAVAGFSGAMIAPLMSISPLLGESYLIPAFLSVLVGGLGSIASPILGAAVIAGMQSTASVFLDSVTAQIIMLITAIVLLKLFPNGLFGQKK